MKNIEINSKHLKRDDKELYLEKGSFSIIAYDKGVEKILSRLYGRSGLCLKIFVSDHRIKEVDDDIGICWGNVPLKEATIIQNIFARENLSPRVYDIVNVNDKYLAQVTDFVPDISNKTQLSRVKDLASKYDIVFSKHNFDLGTRNWRNGKLVDFSNFKFRDFVKYKKELKQHVLTKRGNLRTKAYQPVPGMGIAGTRDISLRATNLTLDTFDFNGLTVLDLGCNWGSFCRLASDRGAKRVVGVDKKADKTFEVNNILGYWNMDFVLARLPEEVGKIEEKSGIDVFDVVFAFAFTGHVGGYREWIPKLTKDWFFLESRGGQKKELFQGPLEDDFSEVEYLGTVSDNYVRHQWKCRK